MNTRPVVGAAVGSLLIHFHFATLFTAVRLPQNYAHCIVYVNFLLPSRATRTENQKTFKTLQFSLMLT